MPRRSDPLLRRWYLDYNKRFFAGRLPLDTLIYFETSTAYGECMQRQDGQFVLTINPDMAGCRRRRRLDLLHEMAHIRTWPDRKHGQKFEDEMLRLAMAGAFKGLW